MGEEGPGRGHLLFHRVPSLKVAIAREVHAPEHLCRAPHLEDPRDGQQGAPLGLPPSTPSPRRLVATVQTAAPRSLGSWPEDWTPRHGQSQGWDSDRRSQEVGGTRRGRGKQTLLTNPEREPLEGACLPGTASGSRPQAGSQTQLFVTGLPVTMATGRQWGGQVSKLLGGKEGGKKGGRRFCPPGWQDWLFLAKNHF